MGRTVFSGTRVEEFQVEVLGVLQNLGPRESIILAKLSGGPLANTGVMQGMSGSPVYIDGKLVGAVAMGFAMSKEAIAGIRPIEDMLRIDPQPQREIAQNRPKAGGMPGRMLAGDTRLEEIATPVSFMGFSSATLDHFAPQLRQLGLDPRQGVSGGGNPGDRMGDRSLLQPGSMISVQLLSGDMSVGADGTVTAIDGDRIYALGHRFLGEGSTEVPFARAEVLALLPNFSNSFKISTAKEWMGAITEDRDTAVSGVLGKRASLIPVEIRLGSNTYRMRMIQDRVMTPLLAQMAVFSVIDSNERSVGSQSYSLRGQIEFAGGPVKLNDVYSGDIAVAALASAGVSSALQFAFQSGFEALKLKGLSLEISAIEKRNQLQIADVIAPRFARPGDDVEVSVILSGENGMEKVQKAHYRVPVGAPLGSLNFTVSDATATNVLEFQSEVGGPQRSPQQVLSLLNELRSNTKAYLRVWRADPSYTVEGRDLPNPPTSLALILTKAQAGTNTVIARGAKLAEIEIPSGGSLVLTGSKTVQVEIKE